MRFPDRLEQVLATLLSSHPEPETALVPMLRAAQRELGFIAAETLREIAARIGVSEEDAENIATYFSFRREHTASRWVVEVCVNVSCRHRGGDAVLERCKASLGVGLDEPTPDGLFTLKEIVCLGACESGPNLRVDRDRHEGMTPEKVDDLLALLRNEGEGSN